MKKTVYQPQETPYSLHDMNIIEFEITDHDSLIIRTQSGMVQTTPPYAQPNGYIEFEQVQWDYSYVYIMHHFGNVGTFTGEKKHLYELINSFHNCGISVMDETFGFNQTKFAGYLKGNHTFSECILEIYHEGNRIYYTEE